MINKVRVAEKKSKIEKVKVYRLEGISLEETQLLAEKLLSEAITQTYTINTHLEGVQDHLRGGGVIEIAYKPGVMNPEVASIMKGAQDLGIKLLAADSSHEYVSTPIFNPLIEYIVKEEPKTLVIKGVPGKTKIIRLRRMSDQNLIELSKDKLFLNLEEMKIIQNYFENLKKDPTDLELETFAQPS